MTESQEKAINTLNHLADEINTASERNQICAYMEDALNVFLEASTIKNIEELEHEFQAKDLSIKAFKAAILTCKEGSLSSLDANKINANLSITSLKLLFGSTDEDFPR